MADSASTCSSGISTTVPTAAKMSLACWSCCAEQCFPAETDTTPRPSFAGVFGMVRITGWPAGSAASSCSSDTAAATLTTTVSGESAPLISRARSAIPTGLTPRITTAAPVAACDVVFRLLLAGDRRDAVVPFGQFGRALGPPDRGDDVGGVGARRRSGRPGLPRSLTHSPGMRFGCSCPHHCSPAGFTASSHLQRSLLPSSAN